MKIDAQRTSSVVAFVVILCAIIAMTTGVLRVSVEDGAPPTLLALLPAVVAIALALVSRDVILALVGGILCGMVQLHDGASALPAALDLFSVVLSDAEDHKKVVIFTLLIGGMVGIVQAGGGARGVVSLVARFATSRRSGMFGTWVLGLCIFFDDYASTLLVGTTMRPLTDRLRISREKLAYIVDSTAAPVASLALVSSWIAYEVSTMGTAMKSAQLQGIAYEIFLEGIPARFYPLLALYFVALVAVTGRDFGPMLSAERRAYSGGGVIAPNATPLVDASVVEEMDGVSGGPSHATLALSAIGTLVLTVLYVLFTRGFDASYDALVYGAGAGCSVGALHATIIGALTWQGVSKAFVTGLRGMSLAVVVLVLAWAIAKVLADLRAGFAVAEFVGSSISPGLLPTITFLLAAVMALSTGTSWGTLAILFPLIMPLLAQTQHIEGFHSLFVATTSSVLAGAVFGDHCSPISDTTVLSSIAAASDHVDHTKTQMPYALLVGAVSVLFGTIPAGFGVPPLLCLAIGAAALTTVFFKISHSSETGSSGEQLFRNGQHSSVT